MRGGSYLLLLSVRNIRTEEGDEADASEERVPLRTMWKEGWSFMLGSRILLNMMLFGLAGALVIQAID
ncbi:hypothetical protein D3C75_1035020 [compost metagenome]